VGLSVVAVNLRVLFRVPRNNPASYNLQGQRTRKWETQNTRTPTVRVWTTKRSAGPKIGSSWTRLDARFKLSLRRASVVNFHGTSPVIERENKIAEEDRLRKVYATGCGKYTPMAAYGKVYRLRNAGNLITIRCQSFDE